MTTAGSMVLLSQATGILFLLFGMIATSISGSLTPPALQALAIDRSHPDKRGKAMATFSLSFQMGSFVGGLMGGFLIDALGYRAFYAGAAIPSVMAMGLLMANWKTITAKAGPEMVAAT
jgi:predicted MFS family arabinose efflux permease